GYKCCSNTNPSILYHDDDGDWSVENDDWCIIKKQDQEEETTTPKLIRTCSSEALGYPCCKEQKTVYSDDDGDWGIENGNWCGI
ncbi:Non-catalytic module family DOC2, partial [Piromyces sp. E2]